MIRGSMVFILLALCGLFGIAMGATVTQSFTYQGTLTNSGGTPLDGNYQMTFKLYDAATGGSLLATYGPAGVTVTKGQFTTPVTFDSQYFDGRARWLGIKVGADPEMTPRQEIRPVPYALSLRPGARMMANVSGNMLSIINLGVGLRENGLAVSTNGQNSTAVHAYTMGPESIAIKGETTGDRSGAISAITYGAGSPGVFGFTKNSNAHALMGGASGTGSDGVYGVSAQEYGVYGQGKEAGGFFTTLMSGASLDRFLPGVRVSTQYDLNPGIMVDTQGSNSNGMDIATHGLYSTGLSITTQTEGSDGIVAATLGDDTRAVSAFTIGTNSPGITSTTYGSGSSAMQGETYGDSTTVFSAAAHGFDGTGMIITTDKGYSEGLYISTNDINSMGARIIQWGRNSYGIHINNNGENSPGIHVLTTEGNSPAVQAEAWSSPAITGKGREGGYFTTQRGGFVNQPLAGVNITTSYENNPGVLIHTEGAGSPGVSAHTSDPTSNAVWGSTSANGPAALAGTTSGIGSPGVYGRTTNSNAHGLYGTTAGTGSYGVYAASTQSNGIWAQTDRADNKYGLQTPDYIRSLGYETGASDVAEYMPVTGETEPGTVVTIGENGILTPSSAAYDTGVAGIVSTNPGIFLGAEESGNAGEKLIAVAGRVPCKVDASYGPIHPRDLLTTSDTPGYAMKAVPIEVEGKTFYPSGIVLGKALGTLESGTGTIEVLVTLQ